MDKQTYQIIGAAMEVHRILGRGFLESVYKEALAYELRIQGIPHTSEVSLPVTFKGQSLKSTFRADLLCFGEVVVELKALDACGSNEVAQLLNYLKAGGFSRGLLLNFGARSLQYRRMCYTHTESSQSA